MRAGRLAVTLLLLGVVTSAVGVALLAQVPSEAMSRQGGSLVLSVTFVLVLLVFGVVGAVVASRMPANPIGWIFLSLAVIEGCYELGYGYAQYSLGVSALPGTEYVAWFANWLSPISPALIGLAFLLFPTGRLVSRRWRPAAWVCVILIVPVVAHYAIVPGPIEQFPTLANPLGIRAASFLRDVNPGLFILPTFACSVVAVFVRFRRSRGVERQQIKWFAWSAGLMAAYLVVGSIAQALAAGDTAEYVAGFVFAVILCGLPVSAGLAILRYRLYDIDLVINRTLVYGTLTVLLAAAYLSSVLVLQLLLNPVTSESDLAVAGSTLAVAGLFRPVRSRIQSTVDRRFYRARYDATRTLESFTAQLRDGVDLEALGMDLRRVVGQTMAPSHVSLWIRGASR